MTLTIDSLGLRSLPAEDRMRLASDLWESVESESPRRVLSDELKAELDRRVAEDDANPDEVISLEDFDASMRKSFAL
jgi:putative addiction module component (TIGR02574 family)